MVRAPEPNPASHTVRPGPTSAKKHRMARSFG